MPIQFPPPQRSPWWIRAQYVTQKVEFVQVQPNLARIGAPLKGNVFGPGIGQAVARFPNLREIRVANYRDVKQTSRVNPVNVSLNNTRPYSRNTWFINWYLNGVTRDTNSATLGAARVMIFRTEDNSFVGEVTSDGSGNWSILMMKGGPFFGVVYKIGSPDVAGTTVNTLTPVPG